MKNARRTLHSLTAAAAMLLAMAFPSGEALALDRITLKDGGKVVEGEISRELDGYVWLKRTVDGVTKEELYTPEQVSKIERGVESTPAVTDPAKPAGEAKTTTREKTPEKATDTAPAAAAPAEPTPKKTGVPKALVLTLGDEENGDMVGVYMVAHVLKRAIPTLEQELGTDRTGVLVLRFHSGGGLGLEVPKISDVIHDEFKPRFRTVGWVETAISAAAMSAHCLEEIYFTSQGNYGACTGFYGSLDKPVEGRPLAESLVLMEKLSARGGWNKLIMRAMQIQQEVSASIDENGEIKFFPDATSGDILVNRTKEILTFNALSAQKVRFSRGTADNIEQLTKLMGYQELDWVGTKEKGSAWPISKSEKMQVDYRKTVAKDERLTNHYFRMFNMNIQQAGGVPREERGPYLNKAQEALDNIKRMVRNNPNFALTVFNRLPDEMPEYFEQLDKQIRDLRK